MMVNDVIENVLRGNLALLGGVTRRRKGSPEQKNEASAPVPPTDASQITSARALMVGVRAPALLSSYETYICTYVHSSEVVLQYDACKGFSMIRAPSCQFLTKHDTFIR